MSDEKRTSHPGFDDAYARLHRLAHSRAERVLGRAGGEAEEVAQEALLRAYAAWPSVAPFAEAWVSRVALNLAISRLRRVTLAAEHAERADGPDVHVAAGSTERVDIARALATLPTRQREVVVLRYVADIAERDVAELLGITTGAVKRHLHRATAALKNLPALAAAYAHMPAPSNTNPEEEPLTLPTWTDHFMPAVEPEGGWPPFPWDHRNVMDQGEVQRLAVDQNGDLIVDADGDEVLTGPGMDYVPVKVLRDLGPDPDDDVPPVEDVVAAASSTDELDANALALLRALERARALAVRFGHTWTGTEHYTLALLEQTDEARRPIALDELRHAIAVIYDGPQHAAARLDLVAARDAAGWLPPEREGMMPIHDNHALRSILQETIDATEGRGTIPTIDELLAALLRDRVTDEGYRLQSLPVSLIERAKQQLQ